MLEIKSLRSGYGAVPVLHDVSFSLQKGETLVLMGRNGVGKTTLLKTIVGIVRASQGEILFNQANVTRWPPHRLARQGLAYVPQGRGIFPKLTVEENLLVGLRARRDGMDSIPPDIFDLFPVLKERMGQLAGTFSGGQQQILALARALCGAPDVLLLDEPSEGIQPSIVQQIAELLQHLNRDRGLTVLLVEQNLELARRAATRCLIMQKGRVTGSLSRDDLEQEDKVFKALSH